MIKLQTTKKNRFGQTLDVSGIKVNVDGKGFCEVQELEVPRLLLADFILVDGQETDFKSVEQLEATEKVEQIIADAQEKANQIIADAQEKANKIIADAQEKANKLLVDGQVEEKLQYKEDLKKLTVEQLKTQLQQSGVPENDYKGLLKDQLIDFIFKLAFQ